jgi:hypothetical protein
MVIVMSVKAIEGSYYLRSSQASDQTKTSSLKTKRAAQPTFKRNIHQSKTKKMTSGLSANSLKTAKKTKRAAVADLNPSAPKKKKLQSKPGSILISLDQQVVRLTHNMTMHCAEIPKTLAGRIIQHHLAIQDDELKSLPQLAVSSYDSDLSQHGIRQNLAIIRINSEVGMGVFLKPDQKAIPKETFIGLYAGDYVISSESEVHDTSYLMGVVDANLTKQEVSQIEESMPEEQSCHYMIDIDAKIRGNFTRLINHSTDDDNLETRFVEYNKTRQIALFTKKKINPGEQLLFSYGTDYWKQIKITPSPMSPTTYKLIAKKTD